MIARQQLSTRPSRNTSGSSCFNPSSLSCRQPLRLSMRKLVISATEAKLALVSRTQLCRLSVSRRRSFRMWETPAVRRRRGQR